MAFAEIGEIRLFYTDEGDGSPALLFVHGYTCDSHDWSWQLPFFAEKHRVIAVDLRGHGRSSAPAVGYLAADFANDLAGLLDKLDPRPVIAIGHSLGGAVVSALAVERPDLVAGLVCVDPGYLIADELSANSDALIAAMAATDDPAPLVQHMFAGFESPGRAAALRTWQLRRVAGVPPHVLRQAFEGIVKGMALISNSGPYLQRRSCAVLSFYADPKRVAVEMPLFNDARSRAIGWEGAGHWLHQERPDEFNALVAKWIASL
jgi:pimeloyl-ACP methyl ester carboxylesterase